MKDKRASVVADDTALAFIGQLRWESGFQSITPYVDTRKREINRRDSFGCSFEQPKLPKLPFVL